MIQTEIDFTPQRKENNSFSQMFLEANIDRITGNNKKVWELLKEGKRLTVNGIVKSHDISSLPRRIKDIEEKLSKELGVPVKIPRDPIDNSKFVEYHL